MTKLNDLIGKYVKLKQDIDTLEFAQSIAYSEKAEADIKKYKVELEDLHSEIVRLKGLN